VATHANINRKEDTQMQKDTQTEDGLASHLTQELDFDDVILWHGAFSYYCGRATIAVSAFISDLIKNWPRLSKKARSLIERDLERAFLEDDDLRANGASYKRLGHDCDRQEWGKVRRLWTDKI